MLLSYLCWTMPVGLCLLGYACWAMAVELRPYSSFLHDKRCILQS